MAPVTAITEFRNLADLWNVGDRCRGMTWVALNSDSGWILRFGLVGYFPPETLGETIEIKTQHIWAGQRLEILSKEKIADELDVFLADPTRIKIQDSWLALEHSGNTKPPNIYFVPKRGEGFRGSRLPALEAHIHGSSASLPTKTTIELELLSQTKPYHGLGDVLEELSVPVDEYGIFNNSQLGMIFSPPAAIQFRTKLRRGVLHIFLECSPEVSKSDLLVGVRSIGVDKTVSRHSIRGDELKWNDGDQSAVGSCDVDQSRTALAALYLSYRGVFCGQWIVEDERNPLNTRLRIHNALDEDSVFTTRFFSKVQPDAFEDQVALLLELLGFTTFKYGGSIGLSDAPDILAVSTEWHVFVVECTTGDINRSGKLHKLNERTKRIRKNLEAASWVRIRVVPVMITNSVRADTSAHWGMAAGFRIALICREDLEMQLGRLPAPPTSEQFYQWIIGNIPTKDNSEPDSQFS